MPVPGAPPRLIPLWGGGISGTPAHPRGRAHHRRTANGALSQRDDEPRDPPPRRAADRLLRRGGPRARRSLDRPGHRRPRHEPLDGHLGHAPRAHDHHGRVRRSDRRARPRPPEHRRIHDLRAHRGPVHPAGAVGGPHDLPEDRQLPSAHAAVLPRREPAGDHLDPRARRHHARRDAGGHGTGAPAHRRVPRRRRHVVHPLPRTRPRAHPAQPPRVRPRARQARRAARDRHRLAGVAMGAGVRARARRCGAGAAFLQPAVHHAQRLPDRHARQADRRFSRRDDLGAVPPPARGRWRWTRRARIR